jgi:hypothetical protein
MLQCMLLIMVKVSFVVRLRQALRSVHVEAHALLLPPLCTARAHAVWQLDDPRRCPATPLMLQQVSRDDDLQMQTVSASLGQVMMMLMALHQQHQLTRRLTRTPPRKRVGRTRSPPGTRAASIAAAGALAHGAAAEAHGAAAEAPVVAAEAPVVAAEAPVAAAVAPVDAAVALVDAAVALGAGAVTAVLSRYMIAAQSSQSVPNGLQQLAKQLQPQS